MNFDAFMRRVEKGARIRSQNQLALISDDRAYETVLVDSATANVRIPGRVVWLQRRV